MFNIATDIAKGALIGAANVVPGVSGGTMALITGIFERLINAIKSFDLKALRLLARFKFRELFEHIDGRFLLCVGIGVAASILSVAKLLEFLFENHGIHVWSYFFGLILASVYFVGKRIQRSSIPVIALFILGSAIAGSMAFMEPANENTSLPYLLLCGAVAMCAMILPGLSGSYVLLLMGNYQLVMIKAVSGFDLRILAPVGVGAVVGLLLFAHLLSWIFKNFHDQTIALLTGFIFGSLCIVWPWKDAIVKTFQNEGTFKEKIVGYDYYLPNIANVESWIALALVLAGIATIAATEILAKKTKPTP